LLNERSTETRSRCGRYPTMGPTGVATESTRVVDVNCKPKFTAWEYQQVSTELMTLVRNVVVRYDG
jgi:hypothetical protein